MRRIGRSEEAIRTPAGAQNNTHIKKPRRFHPPIEAPARINPAAGRRRARPRGARDASSRLLARLSLPRRARSEVEVVARAALSGAGTPRWPPSASFPTVESGCTISDSRLMRARRTDTPRTSAEGALLRRLDLAHQPTSLARARRTSWRAGRPAWDWPRDFAPRRRGVDRVQSLAQRATPRALRTGLAHRRSAAVTGVHEAQPAISTFSASAMGAAEPRAPAARRARRSRRRARHRSRPPKGRVPRGGDPGTHLCFALGSLRPLGLARARRLRGFGGLLRTRAGHASDARDLRGGRRLRRDPGGLLLLSFLRRRRDRGRRRLLGDAFFPAATARHSSSGPFASRQHSADGERGKREREAQREALAPPLLPPALACLLGDTGMPAASAEWLSGTRQSSPQGDAVNVSRDGGRKRPRLDGTQGRRRAVVTGHR